MKRLTTPGPALLAALALLLTLAALSLVSAQHRGRGLLIELHRAQAQRSELDIEAEKLRIELGLAGQHVVVADAARRLGLRPTVGGQMVFVPGAGIGTDSALAARAGGASQ
jgi:cell division protein FtsL